MNNHVYNYRNKVISCCAVIWTKPQSHIVTSYCLTVGSRITRQKIVEFPALQNKLCKHLTGESTNPTSWVFSIWGCSQTYLVLDLRMLYVMSQSCLNQKPIWGPFMPRRGGYLHLAFTGL